MLSLAAKAAQALGAVTDGWNGFGVLHTAASRVGALDLGFVPGEGGLDAAAHARSPARSTCSSCSAPTRSRSPAGAFVVYQGTHGDKGAHRADVILPGAAYTEKSGIYVNTEGRVQMGDRATFPPGEAREDWAILRALSAAARQDAALRLAVAALRQALYAAHPHFAALDCRCRAMPPRIGAARGPRRQDRQGGVRPGRSATST